MTEETPSNC